MLYIVGIGPGDLKHITFQSKELICNTSLVFGHHRHLKDLKPWRDDIIEYKTLDELKKKILNNKEENMVVVASGNPSLYGIGEYLRKHLGICGIEVSIISGISSIQYLFSKIPLSMNDLYITSSHGKDPDFDFLLLHPKVAMVTDQKMGPYEIAQEIKKRGISAYLIVGENLTYPGERIGVFAVDEVSKDQKFDFNVTIITKENPYE